MKIMEPFIREATKSNPSVIINFEEGQVSIKGHSHPENALGFYEPIFDAIKEFHQIDVSHITFNFMYDYFNTSSSRCVFLILKEAKSLKNKGKIVTINWHYNREDEDMKETGEDYEELIEMEFEYKEEKS